MEQSEKDGFQFLLAILFICVVVFGYVAYMSSKRKEKIRRKLSQARKKQHIPSDFIVIAFQISNFIVVFSEKYNKNFRLLDNSCKSFGVKVVDYLTNMRPCFFLRFSRKAIRSFFKELKALTNVKLVLYTKLDRQVCTQILENLNLQHIFEQESRIYTKDDIKYASDVDHDTGRVIIISANRKDQDRSLTSYHTLILELDERKNVLLDQNILNNLRDSLIELAQRGRVDTLHEDMHELTNARGLPVHDDDEA